MESINYAHHVNIGSSGNDATQTVASNESDKLNIDQSSSQQSIQASYINQDSNRCASSGKNDREASSAVQSPDSTNAIKHYGSINQVDTRLNAVDSTNRRHSLQKGDSKTCLELIPFQEVTSDKEVIMQNYREKASKDEKQELNLHYFEKTKSKGMEQIPIVEKNNKCKFLQANNNDNLQMKFKVNTTEEVSSTKQNNELLELNLNDNIGNESMYNKTIFKASMSSVNTKDELSVTKIIYTISDDDDDNEQEKDAMIATNQVVTYNESDNHIISLDGEDELSVQGVQAEKSDNPLITTHLLMNDENKAERNDVQTIINDAKSQKLLYKFDIDDSSQESCVYKEPEDAVEGEISNDTFASLNEEEESRLDIALKPSSILTTSNEILKSSRAKHSKEHSQLKINGNYNTIPQVNNEETAAVTTDKNTCHNNCKGLHLPLSDDILHKNVLQEDINMTADIEPISKFQPKQGVQTKLEPAQHDPVIMNDDSSLASSLSSSTATSSLHQLVIDHHSEELEAVNTLKSHKQSQMSHDEDAEEKISAFKPSLKRKLDDSCTKSAKRMHCDQPLSPSKLSNYLHNRITKAFQCDNVQPNILEQSKSMPVLKIPSEGPLDSNITVSCPVSSLLLQQLQRPYNSALSLPSSDWDDLHRVRSNSFSFHPQNATNTRNFICFKCKLDNFDSMSALYKHLENCLVKNISLEQTSTTKNNNNSVGSAPIESAVQDSIVLSSLEEIFDNFEVKKTNSTVSGLNNIVKYINAMSKEVQQKKLYYKCISCATYHESWHFFLHMKEKHERYMCIYCIRFFPTAEKLSLHLEIKHDLEQDHYNSEYSLRQCIPLQSDVFGNSVPKETRFLMCCTCQHVFVDTEPFTEHSCADYIKPCVLCGQKGRHTNECKARPDKRLLTKTKKKCKSLKSELTPIHIPLEQSSYHSFSMNADSLYCDNNMSLPSTLIAPAVLTTTDNNNSKQMEKELITSSGQFNEIQQMDKTSIIENGELQPFKLVVPKFKLRVPKEFQKSVDAAISSTESDEDYEENEDEDRVKLKDITTHIHDKNVYNSINRNSILQSTEVISIADEGSNLQKVVNEVEDDSLEESNSNLIRIMKEIERTKLDIQRTKEERLNSKSNTADTCSDKKARHQDANISNENIHHDKKNWSPTPPASPHSRHLQVEQKITVAVAESEVPVCAQELANCQPKERRDTMGSDTMDIDESISCDQVQIMAKSKSVSFKDKLITDRVMNENNIIMNSSSVEPPEGQQNVHDKNFNKSTMEGQKAINEKDKSPLSLAIALTTDSIEIASEDTQVIELQLDRPLEKYLVVDFVRVCLEATYPICLYCNHARRIAVNGESLVLHMIAQHRFCATVDSITAEELMPETIIKKLKTFLPALKHEYFNACSYSTIGDGTYAKVLNERVFECFQCRFVASTHKELYLHNRKMHLRTAILCFMCRANFFSFSEILCHMCPGAPHKSSTFDVLFRCCLCVVDKIPSPFRLMVHLRRQHCTCDVCLEDCRDQSRLSSHVWKHKLHHVCYRCGIAYRNKMDITKHLFWKHGTESIICKRCMQKRWRHVYHFCVPPTTFICDVCSVNFSKAMYLKVHKRIHIGDLRYPCTDESCEDKFISRNLLLKHAIHHQLAQSSLPTKISNVDSNETSTNYREDIQKCGSESEIKLFDGLELKTERLENESRKSVDTNMGLKIESETVGEQNTANIESNITLDITFSKDGIVDKKLQLKTNEISHKKRKKNKRIKVSLDDLNLTAPNLSESDSSGDSDGENKSRDYNDPLVPNIMLSPPSEAEVEEESKLNTSDTIVTKPLNSPKVYDTKKCDETEAGNVLQLWKNLLQAQQDDEMLDDYKKGLHCPEKLHVVYSDHDYCTMQQPPTPIVTPKLSPTKNNSASKSPRRHNSSRRSSDSSTSSNGDSSSDSNSSCSCRSNCSCSSSDSDSSSSSNSSNDSNSSAGSNFSRVKRHRKKSERDRIRKKSQSNSPTKKHCGINSVPNDYSNEMQTDVVQEISPLSKDILLNESDLQTAESDTDEEFYDEHPQKLATELLAEKRAQLMAQTFLSPSHNFDIVENSRPSTPSLPEDVAVSVGKLSKQKKKKRDRKSSSKLSLKLKMGGQSIISNVLPQDKTSGHIETPSMDNSFMILQPDLRSNLNVTTAGLPLQQPQSSRPVFPHLPGRVSEGSSCSDVDNSLKRSKRTRRPNKFYGYTSDDDSMASGFGQSLIIGARTFKPTPPPHLTWRKEDLPTPSRSIMHVKNKQSRTPKISVPISDDPTNLESVKKIKMMKKRQSISGSTVDSKTTRKNGAIKHSNLLPPIPTLKIRPSQIVALGTDNTSQSKASNVHYNQDDCDEEDEESSESSSDNEQQTIQQRQISATELWRTALQLHASVPVGTVSAIPQPLPMPMTTPQTTVFNHKIPPALLPNPDFATLQYFKANNIRYPIRPPAGARQARDGESVYCYCRCPYDEVSEMIACDGENCLIEWFHFECVGIMLAPQGKWFCAECRPQYSEELYPTSTHNIITNNNVAVPDIGTVAGNSLVQPNFNGSIDSGG